jgi:XTP/dITP diphosphohydrolase
MRVVLATRNLGKVREFRALLSGLESFQLTSLVELSPVPEVIEDGLTFEANAAKKAIEVAKFTGLAALSDDSGLEVDALGGRPGVFSARYAGEGKGDEANNDKLLLELADVPKAQRTARYHVVLAFADPDGMLGDRVHFEHGVCEGTIGFARRGDGGFGYDPLFVPRNHVCTMAELPPEQKNRISHRGIAAEKMRKFLANYLPSRTA